MHIVIIHASPRTPSQSNTARIAEAFCAGLIHSGATVETYYLADRQQWDAAKSAFIRGGNLLFALPLYNGHVPGIMMEFLQLLASCTDVYQPTQRKVSFILQSGFPEACQRRVCERYLETLPALLGSQFAGILSHGNTFNIAFGEAGAKEAPPCYERMGELFIVHNATFFFQEAADFTGPEYITEKDAKLFNRVFRFFCEHTAQAQGCAVDLAHKPYQEN